MHLSYTQMSLTRPKRGNALLRNACTALGGGIVGGGIVWLSQTGNLHLQSVEMSYADLAAILLTAVGVIVAIFAGVLALAAFWGFNQLKRDAISAAETSSLKEVREQIENGPVRNYIIGEIERLADEEFKSERMNMRIIRRVDAVTFGRPDADKELEEDGGE